MQQTYGASGRTSADDSDRLTRSSRMLLIVFICLTFAATSALLVLAPQTDRLFSWTIQPPLSAAFLGAGYGAGCVLSLLAFRSRSWADARLALVTVLLFSVLTLAATILHLDRFHLSAPGVPARFAAWVWLVVYVAVPFALAAVVLLQGRRAGPAASASRALPLPLVLVLGLLGAVMVALGVCLFFAPAVGARVWPWPLTPLTARMTGAWLLALGVAAGLALRESRPAHLRIPAAALVVFAALQLVALLAYGNAVAWGSVAAIVYVVGLLAVLGAGLVGLRVARPGRPEEDS